MDSAAQCVDRAPSLAYHEPSLQAILILSTFLVALNVFHDIVDALLHTGILAQLVLGAIFGAPLTDILPADVQSAIQMLGYLGLLLLVVEGGMSTRLDILSSPRTFLLAMVTGLTGIAMPIALSMALLPFAYRFTYLESFVVGASLSSTSLGTTLAVIQATMSSTSAHTQEKMQAQHQEQVSGQELAEVGQYDQPASSQSESQGQNAAKGLTTPNESGILNTRIGTILIGAALLDDIVALVLSSVIASLGKVLEGSGQLTPWSVVRPILTSILLLLGTIVAARFLFKPAAPWLARQIQRLSHTSTPVVFRSLWPQAGIMLWLAIVCAFISVADEIDSTTLIGAFCAGSFTVYAFGALQQSSSTSFKALNPLSAYESIHFVQKRILLPFFFASIGFAIPVREMFVGVTVWKGALFSGLMAVAKVLACLPVLLVALYGTRLTSSARRIWQYLGHRIGLATLHGEPDEALTSAQPRAWPSAFFLGFALVARGEVGEASQHDSSHSDRFLPFRLDS